MLLILAIFFLWFMAKAAMVLFRWLSGFRPQPQKPFLRKAPIANPVAGAEGTLEAIRLGNFPPLLSLDCHISGDDSLNQTIAYLTALKGKGA